MNELFFYLSKILWIVASPDNLFVILLCISLLLLIFNHRRKATLLLTMLTTSLLLITILPVGSWLLYPLEKRFQSNPELPETLDGIIILGGSVLPETSAAWRQLETNQSHERISLGIKLALKYPEARLLFTGGNASLDRTRPTEAQYIKQHFIDMGIAEERILIEAEAKNTAENALYSKQLVAPGTSEKWVLITTAYHMPRSVGVFCQQQWSTIPFPVDHRTVPDKLFQPGFNLIHEANKVVNATHEWLGLLAYFASGKTPGLIPKACNQSN